MKQFIVRFNEEDTKRIEELKRFGFNINELIRKLIREYHKKLLR